MRWIFMGAGTISLSLLLFMWPFVDNVYGEIVLFLAWIAALLAYGLFVIITRLEQMKS